MRLALVRHGHSRHVHAGWIDAGGFRTWRLAYDAAPIRDDDRPPRRLAQLARTADLVVASDLPRALASAKLLVPGREREIVVSPLLREVELHCPRLGRLRLPLAAWALAVGGNTLVRTLRDRYPTADERARIAEAAAWLDDLAAQRTLTVAVTHASFRKQLALALRARGWRIERGRLSLLPWSTWLLTRS